LSNPIETPEATLTPAGVNRLIVATVVLTFLCYLVMGLSLAVIPGYVHIDLGYNSVMAGFAVSLQYIATLLTRPFAGRMTDNLGPKRCVLNGFVFCAISGAFTLAAGLTSGTPPLSLGMLLISRVMLGLAESWIGTGVILWGIRQVGAAHTGKIISWNGICSYGGLAIGAPLGVALAQVAGFTAIGVAVTALALAGVVLAAAKKAVTPVGGKQMAFAQVALRVLPPGLGLALGTVGFAAVATFVTLLYASHGWHNAALALTLFGVAVIAARVVLGGRISQIGGYRLAIICFLLESIGLLLFWLAGSPWVALTGAALTGFGFSVVFPALAVEAVALVSPADRGAALAVFTVFLDVALGATGPAAGLIVASYGYGTIFLWAAVSAAAADLLAIALYLRSRRQRRLAPEGCGATPES
jgi:MFS family permease